MNRHEARHRLARLEMRTQGQWEALTLPDGQTLRFRTRDLFAVWGLLNEGFDRGQRPEHPILTAVRRADYHGPGLLGLIAAIVRSDWSTNDAPA